MIDIEIIQNYIVLVLCYDDDINTFSNNTHHSCFLPFYGNNLIWNIRTQSNTPAQVQAPSNSTKTRNYSGKWDHNLGTKDTTFTAGSHAILSDYSAVAI